MGLGKILDDNVLAMALPSGPPPSLRKDGKKPQKVVPVEDGTGSGSSILNSIGTPVESRSFQGVGGSVYWSFVTVCEQQNHVL
jgi:hypothetical protein